MEFRQNSAKIAAKNDKIWRKISKKLQNLEIRETNAEECENLQIFRLDRCEGVKDLVDLEKCCKMSIYLQKSASIQPRTSHFDLTASASEADGPRPRPHLRSGRFGPFEP